ncbi:acyl-CoA dehydrogenase family protein [Chloroflexota bacterium]
MDLELSKEHKILREAVKDFAEKEIAPLVDEAEKKEKCPAQLFPKLGELGYLCLSYPPEYGAAGLGLLGQCIAIEQFGRVSIGITSGIMVQSGVSIQSILVHGTEEQKQNYIVSAIKGEKIAVFGLTEPNAGSDAAAMETTAVKQDGKYIINGSKIFMTNGTIGDFIVTSAYTDKSLGAKGGVSLIIVDADAPGLTRNKLKKFCARSADTAELFFENCTVPVENLIGEEGKGFQYLMESLDSGRISHSARSIGLAQAAYEASFEYAKQRVQFNQPIYKFQAVSFKLARMAMEIEAARCLMYRAAWLYDQGNRRFAEAAMTKLFASEVAGRVTSETMQIVSGYAIMTDSPLQRYFRDARLVTITEGTSEIQHIVIARGLGLH